MSSDLISALILAIIQGITEWVPVSSSGHLILFERILDFEGGLTFDVALHFGTLMAVFVYFGREITDIIKDFFSFKWKTENGRIAWLLIVASIPAAIVGFLLKDVFDSVLSNLGIVALGFGITGLFLLIASLDSKNIGLRRRYHNQSFSGKAEGAVRVASYGYNKMGVKRMNKGYGHDNSEEEISGKLGLGKAFLIGIAQALAVVPGISRSGATMSSGVLFGLDEKAAVKFAFLMSIPIIFGANIIAIGNKTLPPELIWAALVSFVIGLLSIHVLFKYVLIDKKRFRWFALYCLFLALGIGIYLTV